MGRKKMQGEQAKSEEAKRKKQGRERRRVALRWTTQCIKCAEAYPCRDPGCATHIFHKNALFKSTGGIDEMELLLFRLDTVTSSGSLALVKY